jgi:hypothetical protein
MDKSTIDKLLDLVNDPPQKPKDDIKSMNADARNAMIENLTLRYLQSISTSRFMLFMDRVNEARLVDPWRQAADERETGEEKR